MQCPKCRIENPDDAQTCSLCGCILKNDASQRPSTNAKTSRLAMASLALGILGPFTFLITAALSIALGITSLCRIKKHKAELKGKSVAVIGIAISAVSILGFAAAFVLWSVDAAPIPNDYTIADLHSAGPECARSYELLMSLADKEERPLKDAPAIGLSEQDVKDLEKINKVFKEADYGKISVGLKANAESILRIWQNAKKGRSIISELDTFPEIADLTEPELEAKFPPLKNLRHLVLLHRAYVCLQSCQGNEQIAIDEWIKFNSIFGKLNVNARSLVTKLVCFAGLANGIMAANFIVNNPETSQESLELLAEHFQPLTNEQTSLRNSIIFEYLMLKNGLHKASRGLRLKYSSFSHLKLNSTLRLCRNFWEGWIAAEEGQQEFEKFSIWPDLYPELAVTIDSERNVPWYYKAYNPIGSMLIGILTPPLDGIFRIKTKIQIHSDLFQIVLNKRLGKEVNLKARAYSDEYIIDIEKKKIFSPGPDGKADTKDDIKLTINPEVLGLLPK